MNAQQLWAAYREKSGVAHDNYTAWTFGGDPDGLAELVLAGKKRATCSLGRVYELTGEPIPALGEYSVILNSRQEAVLPLLPGRGKATCLWPIGSGCTGTFLRRSLPPTASGSTRGWS